jgi:hypothetical protein
VKAVLLQTSEKWSMMRFFLHRSVVGAMARTVEVCTHVRRVPDDDSFVAVPVASVAISLWR